MKYRNFREFVQLKEADSQYFQRAAGTGGTNRPFTNVGGASAFRKTPVQPKSSAVSEISPEKKMLNDLGFPRWPQDGDKAYTNYRGHNAGVLKDVEIRVMGEARPKIIAKIVPLNGVSDRPGAWHDSEQNVTVGYDSSVTDWKWNPNNGGFWMAPADNE